MTNAQILRLMKNILFLFLLLSVIFQLNAEDRLLRDLEEIIKSGKIKIAVCAKNNPPFFYRNAQGQLDGTEIRLAKSIAKELGVAAEFHNVYKDFDATIDAVANGEADIAVSFLSITIQRAKKVIFTNPYFSMKCALLGNTLIDAELDFNGKLAHIRKSDKISIAVLEGSSYVSFVKSIFPKAGIVTYKDWDSMVKDTLEGKIYGAVFDEFEVKYVFIKNPEHFLTLFYKIIPESEDDIAIAVNPSKRELRDWLNVFLKLKKIEWAGCNFDKFEDIEHIKEFIKAFEQPPSEEAMNSEDKNLPLRNIKAHSPTSLIPSQ
jgi:ABC-type amino acid transport substrate-binding protein